MYSVYLHVNPVKSFLKVTLPLSLKGVITGVTMVFLPCAMGFTIPYIVSNGTMQLIGNIIERHFKGAAGTYNIGSLTSLLMIIVVFSSFIFLNKFSDKDGLL